METTYIHRLQKDIPWHTIMWFVELKPASALPGKIRSSSLLVWCSAMGSSIHYNPLPKQTARSASLDENLSKSLQHGVYWALFIFLHPWGMMKISSCLYQPWGGEQQGLTLLPGVDWTHQTMLLRPTKWAKAGHMHLNSLYSAVHQTPHHTTPPHHPAELPGSLEAPFPNLVTAHRLLQACLALRC